MEEFGGGFRPPLLGMQLFQRFQWGTLGPLLPYGAPL